jgi:hypothetical protein
MEARVAVARVLARTGAKVLQGLQTPAAVVAAAIPRAWVVRVDPVW